MEQSRPLPEVVLDGPVNDGDGEPATLLELHQAAWDSARRHIVRHPRAAVRAFMKEGFDAEHIYFWDTAFMAQFTKYAPDVFPGIESLDNFYVRQRPDGYIPRIHRLGADPGDDECDRGAGGSADCVNPPLAAWCELDHYRVTGDAARVGRVLPRLARFDGWIEANRRRIDKTYWFRDGAASGMDNSPRSARRDKAGNNVGWVDLAAQQALAADSIARLADIAGDAPLAAEFRAKKTDRDNLLNDRHWCERAGLYLDLLLQGLETENYPAYFSGAKTIASFWPMLAGSCDPARAARLAASLDDPNEFHAPCPVPALSRDNPNFSAAGRYWQGGVWAPTNYMVVRGLCRQGYHGQARRIALAYLNRMEKVRRDHGPHTIWEAYAPDLPRPADTEYGEPVRPDFCGWSALGPVAMLIENIIGMEVDYPARRIVWRSDFTGRHGVRRLRFGPHLIDLVAEARAAAAVRPAIRLDSPVDLTIDFRDLTDRPLKGTGEMH